MAINVVVHGVMGKMGQQVLETVTSTLGMQPIGAADITASQGTIGLSDGLGEIPISGSLADVLDGADVVVDFTSAEGAASVLRTAAPRGVNIVIGSTGITDAIYKEAESLANEHEVGVIIAPNFAMGAVLMIALAKQASRFFDYADLTEMHHEAKIDSPSGTALAIANAALEGKPDGFIAPQSEKELIEGARGATHRGVSVHSARMPGRVAHHELVFGALGQTLTIRHDSVNRGELHAGRYACNQRSRQPQNQGLTVGLDRIMGL